MKLEGTIDTFPLRELIDMISYSSVTGLLNLYTDQVAGHLYFRDGHLYHCDFRDSAGVEALASLFELSRACFSFVSDATCEHESLWGDIDYHLRTAERLAYRWQGIRGSISSLDLVPVLIVPFETAVRRIGPAHHQVLDRIDGQHTLRAIVEDLGWAAIDVAEVVTQMSVDSLLDLRSEAQLTATPPCNAPHGHLFERLLPRPGEASRSTSAEYSRLASEEMVLRALRS